MAEWLGFSYESPWYTRTDFMEAVALLRSGEADPLDWLGEGSREVERRTRMIQGIEDHAYSSPFNSLLPPFPSGDIPAGLLSNRAFNSLRRNGIRSWHDLGSHSMASLYSIRSAGTKTVNDIMNLLISVSASKGKGDYENRDHKDSLSEEKESVEEALRSSFPEFLDEEFLKELRLVLDWARWRRSTAAWGGVLALNTDLGAVPDDVMAAWNRVAATEFRGTIRGATSGMDAGRVINGTLNGLDGRARHVFVARTLQMPDDTPEHPRQRTRESGISPSLEALGVLYNVSRERIRQVQQRTERKMRRTLAHERSVQWLALDIPAMIGTAFPLNALAAVPALAAMAMTDDVAEPDHEAVRRTMVWLAGFDLTRRDFGLSRGGWALRDGVDPNALRDDLRKQALANGMLPYADIPALLESRGVVAQVVDDFVGETLPGLKRFGDAFLPWDGARTDKVAALLRWLGRPATDDELLELLGDYSSPTSARGLRATILNDDRFTKVAHNAFALHEWDTEDGGLSP